jgi:excisionase family DNA binding protein
MQMLTLEEVAERMGIGRTGVRQMIAERKLLAVRDEKGTPVVPERALDGSFPVKHLSGVLTLLHDARYTPEEALRWLTAEDDSLPGTPFDALHENRATEVKRRAQALG